MLTLRHFRFLNPEWFRNPQSQLELTLRISIVLKEIFILAVTRVLPLITLFTILSYIIINNLLLSLIIGLILFFIFELISLEYWYKKVLLPAQQKNIVLIKNLSLINKNKQTSELITNIETAARLSAKGIVNIGYIGMAAWGWEIIFKKFFTFLVKDRNINYSDLLISTPNILLESDQKLWEAANEKDDETKQQLLNAFLDKYGSRVDDMDLANPTLREKTKAVQKLIQLYNGSPQPMDEFKKRQLQYQ